MLADSLPSPLNKRIAMKWEGGNVEYANTVVDDWIEGAANSTGD
jgi:hypothetical protein